MDQSIIDSFVGQESQARTKPCITSSDPPADATPEAPAKPPGRPWLRFFARAFDVLLFSVAAEAILCFVWPSLASSSFLLVGLAPGILLYFFTDALLMAAFGTTPGKHLLRIVVVPDSWQRMTLRQALLRSFNVGWHGLAFGLPVVNLFKLLAARKHLLENGETQWDEKGHFYVLHREAGLLGSLVLVFFSAVLVLTGSVLNYLISDRRPDAMPEYHSVTAGSRENALPGMTDVIPIPSAPDLSAGVPTVQATDPLAGTVSETRSPETKPAQPAPTGGKQEAYSRRDTAQITKMVMADLNQPAAATDLRQRKGAAIGRHVKPHLKQQATRTSGDPAIHSAGTGPNKVPSATHKPAPPGFAPSGKGYSDARALPGNRNARDARQAGRQGRVLTGVGRAVPGIVGHAVNTAPASSAAPGQPGDDPLGAAANVDRVVPGTIANTGQTTGSPTGSSQDQPGRVMTNGYPATGQEAHAGSPITGAAIQSGQPATQNPGSMQGDNDVPPQQGAVSRAEGVGPAHASMGKAVDGGRPVVELESSQVAQEAGNSPAQAPASRDVTRSPVNDPPAGRQVPATDVSAAVTSPAPGPGRGVARYANTPENVQAPQGAAGLALSPARTVVQDERADRSGSTTMQPAVDAVPTVTQQGAPVPADVAGVTTDFEQAVMRQTTARMARGGY